MKIIVISDTHIPERAKGLPKKLLDVLKDADMIIHVGDLVEQKVVEQLRSFCKDVRVVCGNMDSPGVRNLYPEQLVFSVGKFKFAVKHGYGAPDKLITLLRKTFEKEKPDIIIYGHSHQPKSEIIDGIKFFNPGSPTDDVFAPYKSYGLIEINDKICARIIKLQ
ncbi:MAG: metallophosphatase family protein [Candidatus Omnitrophica bacterium]|nr:metallophosphatase family protein [Candidatus Omnitrophota bacterium]